MYLLNQKDKLLCTKIVDSAFKVHKVLGPGLLEKVYERCFCYELTRHGLNFERQLSIPISYCGIEFDEGLRIDVLVEKSIICEIKAVDLINPVWQAQVMSHLKMTGNHIGFLINFNVPLIKNGIRRFCIE